MPISVDQSGVRILDVTGDPIAGHLQGALPVGSRTPTQFSGSERTVEHADGDVYSAWRTVLHGDFALKHALQRSDDLVQRATDAGADIEHAAVAGVDRCRDHCISDITPEAKIGRASCRERVCRYV